MSTKINRDEWIWFSLFAPKNRIGIPGTESGFKEYEVDEEYIEAEDPEENEED